MEQSILTTIKKMLGIAEDYESFDLDVITNINMALMTLNQLGVGPEDGFSISDKSSVWSDFIKDVKNLEGVKTYIFIKTKLVFDPPTGSFVLDALDRQVKELEWRLRSQTEGGGEDEETDDIYSFCRNACVDCGYDD